MFKKSTDVDFFIAKIKLSKFSTPKLINLKIFINSYLFQVFINAMYKYEASQIEAMCR